MSLGRSCVCTLLILAASAVVARAASLTLARFDGSHYDFRWLEENDPVMGLRQWRPPNSHLSIQFLP